MHHCCPHLSHHRVHQRAPTWRRTKGRQKMPRCWRTGVCRAFGEWSLVRAPTFFLQILLHSCYYLPHLVVPPCQQCAKNTWHRRDKRRTRKKPTQKHPLNNRADPRYSPLLDCLCHQLPAGSSLPPTTQTGAVDPSQFSIYSLWAILFSSSYHSHRGYRQIAGRSQCVNVLRREFG